MKSKSANNNLVGRKVLIDWPIRWRSADPQHAEKLKADTKAKEPYFGETGEIVAYNPAEEKANTLAICLDNTKQIIHLFDGAVTITTVSPREEDHKEVCDLLRQILEAVKANNHHG